MLFEYDPIKSNANLEKHGIDFEEAQDLWLGEVLTLKSNLKGENRYKAIGRISGEYWMVCFTFRGLRRRIISARRATQKERAAYDRFINDDN